MDMRQHRTRLISNYTVFIIGVQLSLYVYHRADCGSFRISRVECFGASKDQVENVPGVDHDVFDTLAVHAAPRQVLRQYQDEHDDVSRGR